MPDIKRASRSEAWIKAWLLVLAKTLRGKSLADVDAELCRAWTKAFGERGVTQSEGEEAFRRALSSLVFFPAPSEVIALVDSRHEPIVVPNPIGYVCRNRLAIPIWSEDDLLEGEQMFESELELYKSLRQPSGEIPPSIDEIAAKKRLA